MEEQVGVMTARVLTTHDQALLPQMQDMQHQDMQHQDMQQMQHMQHQHMHQMQHPQSLMAQMYEMQHPQRLVQEMHHPLLPLLPLGYQRECAAWYVAPWYLAQERYASCRRPRGALPSRTLPSATLRALASLRHLGHLRHHCWAHTGSDWQASERSRGPAAGVVEPLVPTLHLLAYASQCMSQ